jgi:anti-sigma B factor antagonist
MGLQTSFRRVSSVVIVDLQGRATLGSDNDSFSLSLRELIDDGDRQVLLNLTGLTQLDSSGLSTVVQTHVRLRSVGGSLKLLKPRGSVKMVLDTLQLLRVIPTYEDEAEAVASFSRAASA